MEIVSAGSVISEAYPVQKTYLQIILGVMFVDFTSALEMFGLKLLHMRREHKSLLFALNCTKHPTNSELSPLNPRIHILSDKWRSTK